MVIRSVQVRNNQVAGGLVLSTASGIQGITRSHVCTLDDNLVPTGICGKGRYYIELSNHEDAQVCGRMV